jgi:hypothetical protein
LGLNFTDLGFGKIIQRKNEKKQRKNKIKQRNNFLKSRIICLKSRKNHAKTKKNLTFSRLKKVKSLI